MTDRRRFPYAVRRERGCVVLTLGASHYHADCAAPLAEALREAGRVCAEGRADNPRSLIVDLAAVVLISSIALREIRSAHVALRAGGARIVAAGGGELVARVLKFAPFISHHASVDAAFTAIEAERAATNRGAI